MILDESFLCFISASYPRLGYLCIHAVAGITAFQCITAFHIQKNTFSKYNSILVFLDFQF